MIRQYEHMTAGKFYLDIVLKSKGMKAINRLHSRSFSTNILRMNAQELKNSIDITSNPEIMIPAFSVENEGASTQLHRETNRLVHNYLCAVSTFIDHSRNFMKKHYSGTAFMKDYEQEISSRFTNDPLCRFVRDLRNFITHRGLPDSSMNLHMVNDHAATETTSGTGSVSSDISYGVEPFLAWEKWSAPAKKYLKNCDEKISLNELFPPHLEAMEKFTLWFEKRFKEHHKQELTELDGLREIQSKLEEREQNSPII